MGEHVYISINYKVSSPESVCVAVEDSLIVRPLDNELLQTTSDRQPLV